ncbi:MAG: N-acetylglucosamine-6-phosphate deacetylase [Aphanocapsa feldmannii 288cV]|nr:MAG: N-acetylglucosamine-6-phosphate deacetylase [Aphanocapsa feldmannii 288cV]
MTQLTQVRLPGEPGSWRVALDGAGRITGLAPERSGSCYRGQSWHGDWLSPAGVDLQINGAMGLSFADLTPEQLPQLDQCLDWLWRQGLEAICPTLVTAAPGQIRRALGQLQAARVRHRASRCRLLGAHLEGPFLAASMRGAHPAALLQPLTLERVAGLIEGFEADIAMITLAPELEPDQRSLQWLAARGMQVCLGHSEADAAMARRAFSAGAAMVTHAFNGMVPPHHRAPGVVGAACLTPGVALGLIADGTHVHPDMAVLLQRMAGPDLVLVSDALAPLGLPDGCYPWDQRQIDVAEGICRLPDGTLAGTALPLLEGVRNLARWSADLQSAILAATWRPRRALGERRRLPELLQGLPLCQALRWHGSSDKLSWERAA